LGSAKVKVSQTQSTDFMADKHRKAHNSRQHVRINWISVFRRSCLLELIERKYILYWVGSPVRPVLSIRRYIGTVPRAYECMEGRKMKIK
jgi:hypothetical protein